MYEQILKDLDNYLGYASLADQLQILNELKGDIQVRIDGVEEELEDLE